MHSFQESRTKLRTEIKDEFVGELRQLQNKNEQLEAELQTFETRTQWKMNGSRRLIPETPEQSTSLKTSGIYSTRTPYITERRSVQSTKSCQTTLSLEEDGSGHKRWIATPFPTSTRITRTRRSWMRNASYSKVSNHQSWSTSYSTILQEPNCRSSKTSEHLISSQLSSTYTLHKKSESLEECKLLENSTSSPNPKPMKEWEAAMTHSSSGRAQESHRRREVNGSSSKNANAQEKSHQVAFSEANQIQVGEEEKPSIQIPSRETATASLPSHPTININISVGLSPIDSNSTAWMERNDEQPIHPRDSRQGIQIRTQPEFLTNQGILKIPPISERVTKSSKRLFNKRYSRGIERSTRVLSVFHDKTKREIQANIRPQKPEQISILQTFQDGRNQRSNFVNHQGLFLYKNRFKGRLPFNTIRKQDQQYLGFSHQGKTYRFTRLPFA